MSRVLRTALVAAALALVAGCARAEPPRPLLWKVSDGDNAIYLLGSFHALKPGDYPLAPAVDVAFDDAEQVAFELAPEELESPDLPRKMLAAAQLPVGQTLEGVLSARRWKQLQAYARKRGLPLENFARVEPWFLSLVISVTEMQRLGFDPQQGLDRQLVARAQAANKPTLGLETGDEQIAALDSMNLEEQRQALAESLDEAGDYRRELEKLHDRWRAGDAEGLFADMGKELRERHPQLYQRIDVDRNKAWLPKLQAMLDGVKDRDTLVVVGSLHLLGPDGLVAMLRARGYRVERL